MDESKISQERREVLQKIQEYEKNGWFDKPIENDPEAPELLPDQVDYLCKKASSRFKRKVANFVADRYFLGLIKKDVIVIDGICGEEYLEEGLKNGAMVTCNHFSPFDNYIVFHAIRKYLPKKYLYKIIREGNYTNFPGLYGFFFRHCNTLPLSRNRRTMMNFMSAVNTLLKDGESILLYPEQEMWWNYRKPRPFKIGGFKMAYKAGVPVLPVFISMQDDGSRLDENGYPVQRHTVHVLPPIYPNMELGEKAGSQDLLDRAQAAYREAYESAYGKPLAYSCDAQSDSPENEV